MLKSLGLITAAMTLTACSTAMHAPDNWSDVEGGKTYMAERRALPSGRRADAQEAVMINNSQCIDSFDAVYTQQFAYTPGHGMNEGEIPLSPGDLVSIQIEGDDLISGVFEISPGGRLTLPHLSPIMAAGFTADDLEAMLAATLVAEELYRPSPMRLSLEVIDYAPAQVFVSGAVFQAGMISINDRKAGDHMKERIEAIGDAATGRRLSVAVRAASGVRPDADIKNVVLVRAGTRRILDLSGALMGAPFQDLPLIAGDQIIVPSRGCFQADLMRPSAITAPGIRVYLSNLTKPAPSNALSAIGKDAWSLPYGTRFLQALVSANCVGGTQATNANRFAVLISTNPLTGESEVISRPIEALVRRRDRDSFNPYLLPNDAIACYDSIVTNVQDVVSIMTEGVLNATFAGAVAGGIYD
jgi:protein involved in polysaccharide export with SLBB domain